MSSLADFYNAKAVQPPKFIYIACCRKSGTRLFAEELNINQLNNPQPGTIVQEKITTPQYPTFFLVAPISRQGCVSPTCYKIIYDSSKLSLDKIQCLTYKLCHLYFNWSGTVAVPSPSQYSHKLAFVAANVLRGDLPNPKLDNSLHFLWSSPFLFQLRLFIIVFQLDPSFSMN